MERVRCKCKLPSLLHGADYNPEQWLDMPEILARDIDMMKQAGINCVSVGIFSWVSLEPREGEYTFEWLDRIIQSLYENGIYTVLATPTGAKPGWMAKKYPEILRVEANRVRNLQGGRHNHCYTSPVYREKTRQINTRLAERYANHPAVILWHISNEIQGECHCPLCQAAFREWLKEKYGTLEALNKQYWTAFWSHTYTDWEEIESPAPHGETNVHGLVLDWRRFCTAQTVDFFRAETAPLRAVNPDIPITMNMMGFYDGIDYWDFLPELDIISWDAYPCWHSCDDSDAGSAMWTAAYNDVMRAMLRQPYLLMENTPSTTNWHSASRHKRPGFHKLTAVQQLAHGADSIQYFQWRQSRGSCEKFHSAVVSHNGSDQTRIFREVSEVGEMLRRLPQLKGTMPEARVAIIYDVQTKWAIEQSKGPRNEWMGYVDLILRNYEALWSLGIAVDIINQDAPLTPYSLVIAPMTYMLRGDYPARVATFVKDGGTLLATYFSGMVNENDLCYLGETPACGLNEVYGIWTEDIDGLHNGQHNNVEITKPVTGLSGSYSASMLCELIHVKTATVLGTYGSDFYRGTPAFTVNSYGKGKAYYLACYAAPEFFRDFYTALCPEIGVERAIDTDLPYGVVIGKRSGNGKDYYFIQNFNYSEQTVVLPFALRDLLTGAVYQGETILPVYAAWVCAPVEQEES